MDSILRIIPSNCTLVRRLHWFNMATRRSSRDSRLFRNCSITSAEINHQIYIASRDCISKSDEVVIIILNFTQGFGVL